MTGAPASRPTNPTRTIRVHGADKRKGELRPYGGSDSDAWNEVVLNQLTHALWIGGHDDDNINRMYEGAALAMEGIAPRNEIEAMAAAQMIAAHSAAMECHRRAMLPNQTFEGRSEALTQANKLSRTYATLWEAFCKSRTKGKQRVIVKHVHVHPGAQAVVGTINQGGPGPTAISETQSHENRRQLSHAPQPEVWSKDQAGDALPVASDAEWPLPDARRD
jgi:hypothetical protein